MKIFKITLLAALISSPLAAEGIDKTWEIGVFGDYIKSATGKETSLDWQQMEAGKGVGIDLQKIISDDWSARLELAKTRYETDNGYDHDYGTRFGIDALYNVNSSNFYVFAGVKRFNNAKSYNAVNVGAGYAVDISERFSLYSEAVIYRDVNYGETDQGIKIGLKYAFGDVKKSPIVNEAVVAKPVAPKVMPADIDNDGVVDAKDSCNNTPKNVKVDSKGCTLYSEETAEINLDVTFANNSSQVEPAMMNDIQRLADFMKEYKDTSVVIEGHSSAAGNDKYNLMISKKRADAVKNVLTTKYDIAPNRLSAVGFGETQLISKGNTSADHKKNRRVIAKIETNVKKVVTK